MGSEALAALEAVSGRAPRVRAVWAALALWGAAVPGGAHAQDQEERAVVQAVQAMFDAMEARDPDAFRASMVPGGFLLAVGSETTQRTTREQFAERLPEVTTPMVERIWNPDVRIDGPVATIWAAYDFYRGLEFSHCGTDVVQLAKTPDGWKVVVVSYTVRMPPDCRRHPDGPPRE